MGKGGLNRLLLSASDLSSTDTAHLPASDARAIHIRTILFSPSSAPPSQTLTLRVAVEHRFVHDGALATILPDASVRIELPDEGRSTIPAPPPVILLVAMQRPKVMQRLLGFAASLGVEGVIVTAAEKVEKSYWDCKLFRADGGDAGDANGVSGNTGGADGAGKGTTEECAAVLPGRVRGEGKHPERDATELRNSVLNRRARRVDGLDSVRRRLAEGVEQGAVDGELPWVVLHRGGLSVVLSDANEVWGVASARRTGWSRVVAHAKAGGKCVTEVVQGEGAVVAIGPEGGWTDEEVAIMLEAEFVKVTLGERVLRSETAAVVALGLAHESLRVARKGDADGLESKRRREE